MKNLLFCLIFLGLTANTKAQNHSHESSKAIVYPDIPGYKSLTTDLHIHSVFSDGNVWPSIRVQEALRENLDAISLTEHLEYQPHLKDIPHPDRNRAHELALKEAADHNLLIIQGSEITRSAPVGHNNACLFQTQTHLLVQMPSTHLMRLKSKGALYFGTTLHGMRSNHREIQ